MRQKIYRLKPAKETCGLYLVVSGLKQNFGRLLVIYFTFIFSLTGCSMGQQRPDPKNLLSYPSKQNVQIIKNDTAIYKATFQTTSTAAEVLTYYKDNLPKQGWSNIQEVTAYAIEAESNDDNTDSLYSLAITTTLQPDGLTTVGISTKNFIRP